MATYAEFLKANGATDADITILDVPVARKAYEKAQSDMAEASRIQGEAQGLRAANDKWYNEQALPTIEAATNQRIAAQAELAAERARNKTLQDAGLIEVAENADAVAEAARRAAASGQPTFDASKYVTTDLLTQVANREGDAIAIAQDIAYEHGRLFPDKPLNFRQLRKEAVEKNISVESLWESRYSVPAAREAKATAERTAYEAKIASDAVARFKSEHPATNPALGYATPSSTPFTGAVPSANDAALPWLKSDNQKVNDRISKVLTKHPDLVQ